MTLRTWISEQIAATRGFTSPRYHPRAQGVQRTGSRPACLLPCLERWMLLHVPAVARPWLASTLSSAHPHPTAQNAPQPVSTSRTDCRLRPCACMLLTTRTVSSWLDVACPLQNEHRRFGHANRLRRGGGIPRCVTRVRRNALTRACASGSSARAATIAGAARQRRLHPVRCVGHGHTELAMAPLTETHASAQRCTPSMADRARRALAAPRPPLTPCSGGPHATWWSTLRRIHSKCGSVGVGGPLVSRKSR